MQYPRASACEFPEESVLHERKTQYDWFDSYRIDLADPQKTLTPREVCERLLEALPFWARLLFAVRNRAARLFGLHGTGSVDDPRELLQSLPLNEGDEIEKVKIFTHTPRELVVGMDDWHLNFRASLLLTETEVPERRRLILTTTVHFNRFFGRLYFLPVKPFHKLIVRSLLNRVASQITTRRNRGGLS